MVNKKTKQQEEAVKVTEQMIKEVSEQEKIKDDKEKVKMIEKLEEVEAITRKENESEDEFNKRNLLDKWVPKTELGRLVKTKKIKSMDEILESGRKVLEAEIVDSLLVLKTEFLNIGQAKGKFGGGKRRGWRQTQKKTMEGNVVTFTVMAVVGDEDGHVGIGFGRAAETHPAKEKAVRIAKLNVMKINRGCASYDCSCKENHSIPMSTNGKCSSVKLEFFPAPQGTGLVVGDQVKKILKLAGIKDVYGKSRGKTCTTINVAKATMDALKKLNNIKQ